jgi:hypothetical protein
MPLERKYGTYEYERGLISLWLYKENKLQDEEKVFALHIFP